MIARAFVPLMADDCTILWTALYGMDGKSEMDLKEFLNKVKKTFKEDF